MVIKTLTTPCICCHTILWNIDVSKQAINSKLQGSVATYLRCGGVINNQIKKVYCWICQWKKYFKSANIWQANIYKQECRLLVRFVRLATTLLEDEYIDSEEFESAEVTFNVIPGDHRPR